MHDPLPVDVLFRLKGYIESSRLNINQFFHWKQSQEMAQKPEVKENLSEDDLFSDDEDLDVWEDEDDTDNW